MFIRKHPGSIKRSGKDNWHEILRSVIIIEQSRYTIAYFITKKRSLKATLLKIASLLLPLTTVAQQPVLKAESINTNRGANSAKTMKVDEYQKGVVGDLKQDIVSLEPIATDAQVVIVGKMAPLGVDINFIPLYGGYTKTELQLKEEQNFLADCDRNFSSRKEASLFFSRSAWDYLSEGGKDLATHRFNLAWTLDNSNIDVFWGLGVVAYQKGNFHEAIELMDQGLALSDGKSVTLLVDLATVYIKCFTEHKEAVEMQKAHELLEKAIELNPDFTNAYMQLCLASLVNGNVDQAWLNFHKAYEVNPEAVSVELLAELLEHSEDPKGIFKKP